MIQVMSVDGNPGATQTLTSSDTSTAFSSSLLTVAGRAAQGAIITVETNPVKIAFGADPVQGAGNLGHILDVGAFIRLSGPDLMENFRYISSIGSAHGKLQVTPLY
jgi:hypothetical protein